jgi:flagellar hook-basal body complex protein FliE
MNVSGQAFEINPINATNVLNVMNSANANNNETFSKVYRDSFSLIETTNQLQKNAYQAQIDLATGQTDDFLAVMMAQEKATTSLNFTVQVTNRLVESYREIMRMQL